MQVKNVRLAMLVDLEYKTPATEYLAKLWVANCDMPAGTRIHELPLEYLGCQLVVRNEGLYIEVEFDSLKSVQAPRPLAKGIRAEHFLISLDVNESFKPSSIRESNGITKVLRPLGTGTRILVSGFKFSAVIKAANRLTRSSVAE